MIDERIKELIHADLDGELDEAGRAELDAHLAAADDARAYRDEMQDLDAFLTRVPDPEMPDRLHASIMDSISLPKARRGGLGFGLGQVPGFVRYGFAAAAGLVLAIGMYEYRPGPGDATNMSDMVGTIMPGRGLASDEKLDGFSFDIEQLSTDVALLQRQGSLVLDMRLDAAQPVSVTVDFADEGLRFDAIAQMKSDLNFIEVTDHTVHVEAAGRQHFAVVLHQDPDITASARIRVNVSSGGKLLKTEDLIVN